MRVGNWYNRSRDLRRLAAAALALGLSSLASAQSRSVDPQAAREGVDAAAVSVSESELDAGRVRPLASPRNVAPSRNESYNRARAAEGRLGIRLGNDVSVRVSD